MTSRPPACTALVCSQAPGTRSRTSALTREKARLNVDSSAGDLNDAWFAAHEQFHQSLLRGGGNGRLYAAAMSLRDAASL